jgi:hypothetical protein
MSSAVGERDVKITVSTSLGPDCQAPSAADIKASYVAGKDLISGFEISPCQLFDHARDRSSSSPDPVAVARSDEVTTTIEESGLSPPAENWLWLTL